MAQCTSCGLKDAPTKMRVIEHKISGEQRYVCNERCMNQIKIGWPVQMDKVTDRWRDIAFPPIVRELRARYPELPADLKIRYAPPGDAKRHPGPVNLADMFGAGDNHTLFLRAANQESALMQLHRMGKDAGTAERGFLSAQFMKDMAATPVETAASFDAQMRIAIAEFQRLDRGEPSAFPTPAPVQEKSMPSVKRPAVKKQKEEEPRRRSPAPAPASAPGATSTLVTVPPARRSPVPMVVDRPSTLVMAPPADTTIADLRARKTALGQMLQTRADQVQEDADRRKAVHDEAMATYARLNAEYKAALARLEAGRKVEEAQYAAAVERRIQEDERAVGKFNAAVAEVDERMRAFYDRERVREAAAGEQDEQRRRDEEEQREFDRMQEKQFEQQARRAEAKGRKREEKEAAERAAKEADERRFKELDRQMMEREEQRRRELGLYSRDDLAIADHARPLTRDTFSWYDIPHRRPFSLKDPALVDLKQFRPFAIDQLYKIMTDCVLTKKMMSPDFETERGLGRDARAEFEDSGTTKEQFVTQRIKMARAGLYNYLFHHYSDGSEDEDELRVIRNIMRSEQVPEHWKAFFREIKERYTDKTEKFRDDALLLVFAKFWSHARSMSEDEFGESSESGGDDEDEQSQSDDSN